MAATIPARKFQNGDAVRVIGTPGTGVVIAASLIGKRHPGWVYTVEYLDGRVRHAAQGLIGDAR